MSFRRRTVMLAAGAVAAAVVIASVVVYFVTRSELLGQIDMNLRQKPASVVFEGSAGTLSQLSGNGKAMQATPAQIAGLQLAGAGASASEVAPAPGNAAGASGASASSSASADSGASAGSGQGAGSSASADSGHGASSGASAGSSGSSGSASSSGSAGGGAGSQSSSRSVRVMTPAKQPAGEKTETVTVETRTVKLPRGTLSAAPSATGGRLELPKPALGGAAGYVQLLNTKGRLLRTENGGGPLPVDASTREVAAGKRGPFFSNLKVEGTQVRMFTEAAGKGGVWQAALPLTDFDSTLSRLRLVLALVCLGGIALAAALGLLVSRAALSPVRRLTRAAERVARTQDLGHRIEGGSDDDLGRLAASFNTMLAALERSRLAQRQLVADASHELRTPITSVQANLDALALGDRLAPAERSRIVAAVQAQLGELTVLVGDLVDLSKTDVEEIEVEEVRLDLAVRAAIRRAQLHAPACEFVVDDSPCLVRAAPARLDRAIANLLDNACQWGPGAPIEVRVRDGAVEVRDHGPGISEEDLPRVFDRFYRAPAARSRPGSGLGLAIVRQAAESHGGAVHAANAPGGGARLTLELPAVALSDAELLACRREAPTPA